MTYVCEIKYNHVANVRRALIRPSLSLSLQLTAGFNAPADLRLGAAALGGERERDCSVSPWQRVGRKNGDPVCPNVSRPDSTAAGKPFVTPRRL